MGKYIENLTNIEIKWFHTVISEQYSKRPVTSQSLSWYHQGRAPKIHHIDDITIVSQSEMILYLPAILYFSFWWTHYLGLQLTNILILMAWLGFATGNNPADTLRNNGVVITSKRRDFDVITSKWRRFDVITTFYHYVMCSVGSFTLHGIAVHL